RGVDRNIAAAVAGRAFARRPGAQDPVGGRAWWRTVVTQPEHSVDAFLGGLVTVIQTREGHRAGLDAALLQALVPTDAAGFAVDFGTGVGTVAFCIAARAAELDVVGLD